MAEGRRGCRGHTGVEPDEAREYVDALVDAKVLTPIAEPAVTGPEPLAHVLSSLSGQDLAAPSEALRRVSDELAALGRRRARQSARGVRRRSPRPCSSWPAAATMPGWSRSTCTAPVRDLTLGRDDVRLLAEAVDLLHRLSQGFEDPALTRFKAEFGARYEDREVPLMEALDEEMGIGFDRSTHPAADESPLLAGIDLGGVAGKLAFTVRDAALLDLVIRARDNGAARVELDADAVARLASGTPVAAA